MPSRICRDLATELPLFTTKDTKITEENDSALGATARGAYGDLARSA
jgi:hypothetical protein